MPTFVGALEARAAVHRAQRLNALIDETVDPLDEAEALRLWRPLARRYPEDRAVMHGYVLALSRVAAYGPPPGVAMRLEFREAASRLLAMDASSWEAASHAGKAWALAGEWGRALAAYREAERRAGKDRSARAMCLHHQAEALAALGDPVAARRLADRAVRLAKWTEAWRFDGAWRSER